MSAKRERGGVRKREREGEKLEKIKREKVVTHGVRERFTEERSASSHSSCLLYIYVNSSFIVYLH